MMPRRQLWILSVAVMLLVSATIAGADWATAADNAEPDAKETASSKPKPKADAIPEKVDGASSDKAKADSMSSRRQGFLAGLTIFVLAVFVGFEVIAKVPTTLHTPLMSGSNAISGITLVGAVIVAGSVDFFPSTIGMLAVALAMINAVGGFLVTHRMLAMFKKR